MKTFLRKCFECALWAEFVAGIVVTVLLLLGLITISSAIGSL